jgi:hypothetical protein
MISVMAPYVVSEQIVDPSIEFRVGLTVSVAKLLASAVTLFWILTEYCPASDAWTLPIVNELLGALAIASLPTHHWHRSGFELVATTENEALLPVLTGSDAGCFLIATGVHIRDEVTIGVGRGFQRLKGEPESPKTS